MARHVASRLLAVFAIGSLWLSLVAAPASAVSEILWVDDDAVDCPWATTGSIQAAIDAADPGDRVYVCPGTYSEQLTIDKGIQVRAKPLFRAHLNLDGLLAEVDGVVAGVRLTADNAKFRGFRVHIPAGVDFEDTLLPACTRVDVAVLVLGQDNVVRQNKINVEGSETLSGHCGYDYGIVVGQHAPTAFNPTGVLDAISATARVTFNWVRDFKRGGILVEEEDSYAFVRRNDIRYYHLQDPVGCGPIIIDSFGPAGFPCVPITQPSGDINSAFPAPFGIGVESGAQADIIRNAISSGPNAGAERTATVPAGDPTPIFTARLHHGITLTALDSSEPNLVHLNAIWRVTMGIHTDDGADGAVISSNYVIRSLAGLELAGDGDEIHHNRTKFNSYGIVVLGSDNNLHDNFATDNTELDCLDLTTGDGTDGTDNTWTNNVGNTDDPDGICDPET